MEEYLKQKLEDARHLREMRVDDLLDALDSGLNGGLALDDLKRARAAERKAELQLADHKADMAAARQLGEAA